MKHHISCHLVLGTIGALLTLAPERAHGSVFCVEVGWDLFETAQPTTFAGFNWEGVPLTTFDFGGSIGVQSTGTTDTIIRRTDPATVVAAGQTDTIDIELVALRLRSVDPIDLGVGLDHYFITLDPGSASMGQISVTFDDADAGTFDSVINVDFDIRLGALDGPIISSDLLQLSASGVAWDRVPLPGALLIDDVNNLLNGTDNGADFHPDTPFTEEHAGGAQHTVIPGTPEPGSLTLLALAGLLCARRRRRAD